MVSCKIKPLDGQYFSSSMSSRYSPRWSNVPSPCNRIRFNLCHKQRQKIRVPYIAAWYYTCGNQSACDIMKFCSVNIDAWYYRTSATCDTMEFEFILLWSPLVHVVHSTRPSPMMWHMHAPTFNSGMRSSNKRRRRRRRHSTYWHMTQCGCGSTSLVVCINARVGDTRERNATTRNEIWTTNIRSLRVSGY